MILLLDNYDSFTYNVSYALSTLGQNVKVIRSDKITTNEIELINPYAIIISPGPGRPEDAGVSLKAIEKFAGKIPILGICLGHQCIGEVFGGKVIRAKEPVHGKTSQIFHDNKTIFNEIPSPFQATRYHSLIVAKETIKDSSLKISAYTEDDIVMGLRSDELKIEGVQFHPESIGTMGIKLNELKSKGVQFYHEFIKDFIGIKIFQNFINNYLFKN